MKIFGDQEYTFSDIKIVNIAPGSKTEVKIVAFKLSETRTDKHNLYQVWNIVNPFPLVEICLGQKTDGTSAHPLL